MFDGKWSIVIKMAMNDNKVYFIICLHMKLVRMNEHQTNDGNGIEHWIFSVQGVVVAYNISHMQEIQLYTLLPIFFFFLKLRYLKKTHTERNKQNQPNLFTYKMPFDVRVSLCLYRRLHTMKMIALVFFMIHL